MDEEDLVIAMVNDGGQCGAEADEIGFGQLAFKDGVLQVVAPAAHGLKDFAEALIVTDVVADEVGGTHSQTVKQPLPVGNLL